MRLLKSLFLLSGSALLTNARLFETDSSDVSTSTSDAVCNCEGNSGCDQTGCDAPTCPTGDCNQEGTTSPSCGAGDCNQKDTTNPSCGAGYCDQENSKDATCGGGHCNQDGTENASCGAGWCSQMDSTGSTCFTLNCCTSEDDKKCDALSKLNCLGGETRVFSCDVGGFVDAWDVQVGDSLRAVVGDDADGDAGTGSVCTEVYYTYRHDHKGPALEVEVDNGEAFFVSPSHIAYVGDSYADRRPVLAKNLRVGDKLVPSTRNNRSSGGAVIRSIAATTSKLINVLTYEPAIELESGVVISVHSYHDTLYSYLFWPLALSYKYLGISLPKCFLDSIDARVSPAVVLAWMSSTVSAEL